MRTKRLKMVVKARQDYITGKAAAIEIFDNLIEDMLEGQERKMLNLIRQCPDITSPKLAELFGKSQSNVSTLLLNLYQAGLVTRKKVVDNRGRHYMYRSAK